MKTIKCKFQNRIVQLCKPYPVELIDQLTNYQVPSIYLRPFKLGAGRHGYVCPLDSFLSNIRITKTCWLWTACCEFRGYGRIYFDSKPQKAHRVSWQLFKGKIPVHLHVLHTCDVRSCVNPAHLFLGTIQDNSDDMVAKDRSCFGLKNYNHKLDNKKIVRIRYLYSKGVSQSQLGRDFGITPSSVCRIVNRKIWKRV